MGKRAYNLWSFVMSILNDMKENIEELNSDSKLGSKDLDEILRNPEDRNKFEDTIEKLKTGDKKTEVVQFSDRELEISIE